MAHIIPGHLPLSRIQLRGPTQKPRKLRNEVSSWVAMCPSKIRSYNIKKKGEKKSRNWVNTIGYPSHECFRSCLMIRAKLITLKPQGSHAGPISAFTDLFSDQRFPEAIHSVLGCGRALHPQDLDRMRWLRVSL